MHGNKRAEKSEKPKKGDKHKKNIELTWLPLIGAGRTDAFPSTPFPIAGADKTRAFSTRKRSRSRSNSAAAASEVDAEEVPVEAAVVDVGGIEAPGAGTGADEDVARLSAPENDGECEEEEVFSLLEELLLAVEVVTAVVVARVVACPVFTLPFDEPEFGADLSFVDEVEEVEIEEDEGTDADAGTLDDFFTFTGVGAGAAGSFPFARFVPDDAVAAELVSTEFVFFAGGGGGEVFLLPLFSFFPCSPF